MQQIYKKPNLYSEKEFRGTQNNSIEILVKSSGVQPSAL